MWLEILKALESRPGLLNKNGEIIVQIDPEEYEPFDLKAFRESRQRKYGATLLVFYRHTDEVEPTPQ